MRTLVTGHRLYKLKSYDLEWIKHSIETVLTMQELNCTFGLSGMASGVDLWFCSACGILNIPYAACIPFLDQADTMSESEAALRLQLIEQAAEIRRVRNSFMIGGVDNGIVVWDGNKGGTHNVVQQMVEAKKPFVWINPAGQKIWHCF